MQRRTFLATAGVSLIAGKGRGASGAPADKLTRIPPADVKLRGRIGGALDLSMRNRIMAQDWKRLVAAFEQRKEARCWQTEFWGKWFTAAAPAYHYTRDPKLRAVLEQATKGLVATQSKDGYIGNYADDKHLAHWDVWGRKYVLLGLLASHEITRDPASLNAAKRLADHLMTEVGPGKTDIVRTGNFRGMPSSSILEPMVLLHRATKEPRYRAFADYIVGQWSTPDGPQLVEKALAGVPVSQRFALPKQWFGPENGMKAYEMMSCYEGLLELYRLTGTPAHLEAVRKSVDDIRANEINLAGSGASVECWYGGRKTQAHPARHMMETCVTVTWMKLCGNLLRLTGSSVLFDDIERAAYNALLAAMTPDGSTFAKYSPFEGFRDIGPAQCDMGLHCCTASGPRGLFLLPQLAVMQSSDGPVVNLYERGEAALTLTSGTRVTLLQDTGYPAEDSIRIEVRPSRSARFTLSLRIPAWSETNELTVNGAAVPAVTPGAYARIERTWQAGDRVTLKLDMRPRVIPAPDGSLASAVVRGPVLLARDSRLTSDDVDEPAVPKGELVATEAKNGFWMQFKMPFAGGSHDRKGELALCDYASSGNAWDSKNRFRVWLRREIDPARP